jgi:hypothetical protein
MKDSSIFNIVINVVKYIVINVMAIQWTTIKRYHTHDIHKTQLMVSILKMLQMETKCHLTLK